MIMATTPPMTIRKSHQSVRSEASPSHLYENLMKDHIKSLAKMQKTGS